MIRSMTAYGRAASSVCGKDTSVEIKAVNSRYFDCTVKLPRAYGFLEERVKTYLQQNGISRGKVECNISINRTESNDTLVRLDKEYAESYISALYELRDTFGLKDDISVMTVADNRDIFTVIKPEEDTEKDWQELLPVLNEALGAFCRARETEGENLRRDLMQKKEHLVALASSVSALQGRAVTAYRSRLEAKLAQVLAEHDINVAPDDQRIITECAIFADKTAIDEELVRLESHFKTFDDAMCSSEPVGRKLDFLLQEMNRETNTIGSKCSDIEITQLVVEMKCELEKIREQIQNLE